ncbi:hypothetical protein Goarm_020286, partial [Gossypium armourianum]|nr:hypothetical protein [Gossypium armourianum]
MSRRLREGSYSRTMDRFGLISHSATVDAGETGGLISKVAKHDFQTNTGARGKFIRMAVFFDMGNPLISKIFVDGKLQKVEFGSLPTFCFTCGKSSHVQESCPVAGLKLVDGVAASSSLMLIRINNGGSSLMESSGPNLEKSKFSHASLEENQDLENRGFKSLNINGSTGNNEQGSVVNFNPMFKGVMEPLGHPVKDSLNPTKHSIVSFKDNEGLKNSKSLGKVISVEIDKGIPSLKGRAHKSQMRLKRRKCFEMRIIIEKVVKLELRPDIVDLLETRVSGDKANSIIASIGFQCSHQVESHPQFVLILISENSLVKPISMAFVYGSPD